MTAPIAWTIGLGLWAVAAVILWGIIHGSHTAESREQGRVAIEELERWRATANRLARAPLPRVGLPMSISDADGDTLMIRRDDQDPEALIVCVRWVDSGGDGSSMCVKLGWDGRTQAAAALLSVYPTNYTPVGES